MSTDIPLPLTSASTPKLIQLQLYLRYSTFSLTNCISNFLPLHSILILFSEYENKCILQSSYNMCIQTGINFSLFFVYQVFHRNYLRDTNSFLEMWFLLFRAYEILSACVLLYERILLAYIMYVCST